MKAPGPQCLQTPVSTMRQRSMTCCPVSRPAGLSRADTAPLRAARTTVPAQSMQRVGAMATGQEDPETKHLCRRLETCHCVCRGREESGEPPCVKHLSMKSLLWLQQSPHLNFTCIIHLSWCPAHFNTKSPLTGYVHKQNILFQAEWLTSERYRETHRQMREICKQIALFCCSAASGKAIPPLYIQSP